MCPVWQELYKSSNPESAHASAFWLVDLFENTKQTPQHFRVPTLTGEPGKWQGIFQVGNFVEHTGKKENLRKSEHFRLFLFINFFM